MEPGTSSLKSRLPACAPGTPLGMRPLSTGGATPIVPQNGDVFIVMPGANAMVPAPTSIR